MSSTSNSYFLSKGAHQDAAAGRCAMEWVAFLAGEPHSDQPVCVDPPLRRFCIAFNDRLDDTDRQRLRPYLARTIGTAGDGHTEKRMEICRTWLIKVATPEWLDVAGCNELATELRNMPDALIAENTVRLLQRARDEARTARDSALERLKQRFGPAAVVAVVAADVVAAADAAADAADAYAYAYAAYAYAAYAYAAAAAADAAASPQEIYEKALASVTEKLKPIRARHIEQGFELLEQMLPGEVIELPEPMAARVADLERSLA